MTKEFKVLNLTISSDHSTGIENLLAILSEMKDFESDNLPFTPQFFNFKGTYFVFAADSEQAKYLMDNPQDRKFWI